jgi:hypothetical protein
VANLSSPAAVLVTYDNAMPLAHGAWLHDLGVTLTVIASQNLPAGFGVQDSGSWWKYRRGGDARSNGKWGKTTPNRR